MLRSMPVPAYRQVSFKNRIARVRHLGIFHSHRAVHTGSQWLTCLVIAPLHNCQLGKLAGLFSHFCLTLRALTLLFSWA